MDADLESVEIVFAQKLASGEPPTRARALKALQNWIHDESSKHDFNEDSLNRLCKGLHYVMWMQDKMLLQEELADNIASLPAKFTTNDQSAAFLRAFFRTLSKEWHSIDRWRMDKFLMMIRRIMRVLFARLRDLKWKKGVTKKYFTALKDTVISTEMSFAEGLKFHFASIYLDELDGAGGLSSEQVLSFLQPFADLLGDKATSNALFASVLNEIFTTILHDYAERLVEKENEDEDEMEQSGDEEGEKTTKADTKKEGITFDYAAIGKLLFDIGKQPDIKGGRRSKLYELAKKFNVAAGGGDPFEFEVEDVDGLKSGDYKEAIDRVLSIDAKTTKERKKWKKNRKNKTIEPEAKAALERMLERPGKKRKFKGKTGKTKGIGKLKKKGVGKKSSKKV